MTADAYGQTHTVTVEFEVYAQDQDHADDYVRTLVERISPRVCLEAVTIAGVRRETP